MPLSAYIHIPFCKSKCKYCSFVSFCNLEKIEEYIDALSKEIDDKYLKEELKTLYFGGGTPSIIPPELIKKVLEKFNFAQNCEITLELNPDDITKEYLIDIFNMGINRLSIGSQTFDDSILRLIGRRHSSKEILNAVDIAKNVGFKNISLDLIYGLPTQTIDGLKQDLETFLQLDIQHISTYGLKIEEESFWGKNPPPVPDEDLQAEMYELINSTLEKQNFFRYEISNFAKKGFESRHNLNYWNNEEYYGFGIAAHGYINRTRYSNECNLNNYINAPINPSFSTKLSTQEMLEEEIFLGFRKTSGIDVSKINKKFGIEFKKDYQKILDKYSDYIETTPYGYRLNLKGVLISNIILAEFL